MEVAGPFVVPLLPTNSLSSLFILIPGSKEKLMVAERGHTLLGNSIDVLTLGQLLKLQSLKMDGGVEHQMDIE